MYNYTDKILLFFQKYNNRFFENIFLNLTRIVDGICLVMIVCILYWTNIELAHKIIITLLVSGYLVQYVKILFKIPRPFVRNKNIVANVKALKTATGYSFPSGHTQASISIFYILYLETQIEFYLILVILIPFSRIVLRVHNIQDVLMSVIISFFSIYVTYNYSLLSLCYIIFIFSIIFIIYLNYLYYKTDLSKADMLDFFQSIGIGLAFSISTILHFRYNQIRHIEFSKNVPLLMFVLIFTGFVYEILNETIFKKINNWKFIQFFIVSLLIFLINPYVLEFFSK